MDEIFMAGYTRSHSNMGKFRQQPKGIPVIFFQAFGNDQFTVLGVLNMEDRDWSNCFMDLRFIWDSVKLENDMNAGLSGPKKNGSSHIWDTRNIRKLPFEWAKWCYSWESGIPVLCETQTVKLSWSKLSLSPNTPVCWCRSWNGGLVCTSQLVSIVFNE